MHIEITRPEVEALIERRLRTGAFANPEDVIFDALRSSEPATKSAAKSAAGGALTGRNLVEVCAMVQGLADDLDLSRNQSGARPVDLG